MKILTHSIFLSMAAWLAVPEGVWAAPSFTHEVMPLLSRAGCNMGACHAKAGGGQNGFQLSLLGFQPDEDYDHLLKEARGRRVSTAAPEQSLLLLKATASVPHSTAATSTTNR
jgi:hypothetical protein